MNFVNFVSKRILPLALIISLGFLSTPSPSLSQDSITLKSVLNGPPGSILTKPIVMFAETIEERTKGRVKIQFIGGDEVIPIRQQMDALRNDMVDLIFGVTSFYAGTVPEALALLYTSQSPKEQRKSGLHDLMRKIHQERANVFYLGFAGGQIGSAFRLYTLKKVDKADLTGMKIRVSPVYTPLVKALNGTPVMIPASETAMALERKVVEGLGYTYGGLADRGLAQYVKYVIDHPFYTQNSDILFNMKSWKSLPEELQKQIDEVIMPDYQEDYVRYVEGYMQSQDELYKSKGIQFIKFSPEEAKKYVELAYTAGWKEFLKKNPKSGPEIKAVAEINYQ